jgi:hypothetical protein
VNHSTTFPPETPPPADHLARCPACEARCLLPREPLAGPQPCACPSCAHDGPPIVAPGSGPHIASLRCGQYLRWLRWVSKYQYKQWVRGPQDTPAVPETTMSLEGQAALPRTTEVAS